MDAPSSPKSRYVVRYPAASSSTTVSLPSTSFTSSSPRLLISSAQPASSSPPVSAYPTPRSRRRVSRMPFLPTRKLGSLGIILLTILSLFTSRGSAALVTTFTNCLADNVQSSPTHLQFHPLAVDARLDMDEKPYLLQLIIYGNVTGKSSQNPTGRAKRELLADGIGRLDKRGDGYRAMVSGRHWRRDSDILEQEYEFLIDEEQSHLLASSSPSKSVVRRDVINYETTGEIRDLDEWGTNRATTLRSTANVVTFKIVDGYIRFCNVAHTCPLKTTMAPPGANLTNPDFLPSFNVTTKLTDSYAFTSIISTLRIISGNDNNTHIGCIQVEVTPPLTGGISHSIRWVTVGILILVGVATVAAAILNPWNGTRDIFRWSSNYGMDDDMLRLVTPGFGDCLQYLQFAVLTGALSLAYPGFFQPVLSKASWSVLLFNTTLTAESAVSGLSDNLYVADSKLGLERMANYVGIGDVSQVWPVTMAYFAGMLAALVVVIQLWFAGRWSFMKVNKITEEDLRARSRPFTFGNILRIFYNYLLNPFITFNTFQFVVYKRTPGWYTGLAATFFSLYIVATVLLLRQITLHKPRPALYDDLPMLLLFGPLYNTYQLQSNPFFCTIQVVINILRAVTFGGVQQSGIAQITLLVVCEVLLILVINAVRPYSPKTSMNLYQTFFAVARLLTIVFSVAFVPELKIDDGVKGWIGYAVLLCHGVVLVFGFFLNALQTLTEVIARLMGAGDVGGTAARGGLAQVFSKRQLAHRRDRHNAAIHTDISGTPSVIGGHDMAKSTISGVRPHSMSGNSAVFMKRTDMSAGTPTDSTALVGLLDPNSPVRPAHHRHTSSTGSAFTPTSPVATTYPTGFTGGIPGGGSMVGLGVVTSPSTDSSPYYRQPRTRTNTLGMTDSPGARSRASWSSTNDWTTPRYDANGNPITPTSVRPPFGHIRSSSQGTLPPSRGRVEPPNPDEWDTPTALNTYSQDSGVGTPPFGPLQGPAGSIRHQNTDSSVPGSRGKTDYAVREMDFYYGVRGPALSSAAPSRKLGTGPADPTSPMAVAKGWLKNRFGRRKEKAKGFEVVRSSRAPQMLREMQEAAERERRERQAREGEEGIGVAVTTEGEDGGGSSSSSDEDQHEEGQRREGNQKIKTTTDSEEEEDEETEDESDDDYGEGPSSGLERLKDVNTTIAPLRAFSNRSQAGVNGAPQVPRKSSKRRSANMPLLRPLGPPSISSSNKSSSQVSQVSHSQQQPEMGDIISPTSPRTYPLYDPPLPTQAQFRNQQQKQQQIDGAGSSHHLRTRSATRLPFQTSSRHTRNGSRSLTHGHDDNTTSSSPGASRNSSNASSILPPVPGLYSHPAHRRSESIESANGNGRGTVRPASVGTVSRHRMEDSLTEVTDRRALVAGMGSRAELVDRSDSMGSVYGDALEYGGGEVPSSGTQQYDYGGGGGGQEGGYHGGGGYAYH